MSEWASYAEYLQSEEWREKRDRILLRAGYLCEIGMCSRNASEVHHLTYERLYDEAETDLVAVCKPCHDTLTDDECEVKIRCLEGVTIDCACAVCLYEKAAMLVRRRLRQRLARRINRAVGERILRLYGDEAKKRARCAGLQRKPLPPELLCLRTGEPAGLNVHCRCDACLWLLAAWNEWEREEREPDE